MINYHKELLSALETILPAKVHYEMILHSCLKTPCISYMELNNYSSETGDTLGYSRITYQIKVWSNDIGEIQNYALKIDEVLRPLGFKRIASGELYDNQSSMIQKVMTFEALGLESYE